MAPRAIARPNGPLFCDTSIIYYRLHAHELQKQAVRDACGRRPLLLSNFVRGEYIRGYIYGLILLYTAIRAENSVSEGIHVFIADSVNRHWRIQNAFESTALWLTNQNGSSDVEATLERLADMLRNCLLRLDEEFPKRQRDPLACEFGVLAFPSETMKEDHVLDLYQQIDSIRDSPGCLQCAFRTDQIAAVRAAGIDLHSQQQRQKYKQYKGYVKQAKYVADAEASTLTKPSCWYCDMISDTIIALQCPKHMPLITGDAQSFPALAEILDKDIVIVLSLKSLIKARRETGQSN